MMIFKKAIARRSFLRGIGATIALPLLDSMTPAFAANLDTGKEPTRRMSFFYGPNGRIMKYWTPKTTGTGFEMSRSLAPLEPLRDQVTILSGLNIKAADAIGNEPGGVHARPCAAWLTGLHPKPGGAMGVSVDQHAAKVFSKKTQLASLELAMDSADQLGANDGAYSDAYTKTISWRGPTSPLPMEDNPRKVFERLIGDSTSTDPAVRKLQIQRKQSVLDFVMQDTNRMMRGVGENDKRKLAEYLDSLRDIERRIQLAEEQSSRELPEMDRPAGVPETYSEHAKLMMDLKVLAFQGDLTRVTTFMWGREQGDRAYREIGVRDGHHSLSHHAGFDEAIELCSQIDRFHCELFAYFLDRMQKTQEGDGNLLENSIILLGSGLGDGNAHMHNDVPALVAGGAGGKLKGGRHIKYEGIPFANLHLTLLDLAGVPTEGFLDPEYSFSTGKLDFLSL